MQPVMMLDQTDEDLPTYAILRQRLVSLATERRCGKYLLSV
ncbi:hypothetical protein [Thalassospira profundimaris]|nr:hypothetical protein [Thalassospira profundimaris]